MKPMHELSVRACEMSLLSIAEAMQTEAKRQNFAVVLQLANLGGQLYNLAHNGEMIDPVPPALPTGGSVMGRG